MTGLREKVLLGIKRKDGSVLLPPTEYDPETSEEIIQLLQDISSKKTVLMASHDKYLMDKFPKRTIICDKNYVSEK